MPECFHPAWEKNMKIKALTIVAFILAVIMFLPSCKNLRSSDEELAAVMTADGMDVTYEMYRYFILNYKNEFSGGDAAFWNDDANVKIYCAKAVDETFASIRKIYGVLSLCNEHGISMDDEYIGKQLDEKMKEAKETFDNTKEYAESLKSGFMTDNLYRFLNGVTLCQAELKEVMLTDGSIATDKTDVLAYLNGDGCVRVKQLYISNDDGDDPDANKALADELKSRVSAGEDFDALTQECGEDLNMFNNPDGYYITKGYWENGLEDVIFALDTDEVSEVVDTGSGYVIYKRCEKEESYIEKNYDSLYDIYCDSMFTLACEKRAAEIEIVTNDLYNTYSVKDMKFEED